MTKLSTLVVIVGAAACARRPPVAAPTTTYDCADTAIVLHGDQIAAPRRRRHARVVAPTASPILPYPYHDV